MKMQEVSKRYARALFEAATQVKKTAVVLEQLAALNNALHADAEALGFFDNPMNTVETKLKVLSALTEKVKFIDEVNQFLKILVQNGRLQNIAEVITAFQGLLDESQGVVRGKVISAQQLTDEAKKGLTDTLSKVVNKKVIFDYDTNPSIIGGVTADIHGLTFDDTIQRHLNRMNEDLMKKQTI